MKERHVVGEADKLRALTEDPGLRELMEKYYAEGKGGSIREAFIERAEAAFPDWRETVDWSSRAGEMLLGLMVHCVQQVRSRADLSEIDRLIARKDEADFKAIFDKARNNGFLAEEDVYRLGELAMGMAVLAGLSPEEHVRLRNSVKSEFGRKGGETEKTKPWHPQARERAYGEWQEDPNLSDGETATAILAKWEGLPKPPEHRSVAAFVGKLPRPEGAGPKRRKARRRLRLPRSSPSR
jgi:hypothetical protein